MISGTPLGSRHRAALLALLLACGADAGAAQQTRPMPRLAPHGSATHLLVDGAPYLVLGGELGNSTASDLGRLERYWPLFDSLHLNSIIAPVSWELIEPAEGQFDFASVDGLLRQARAHRKRLVLLWFGSWKNSMSSYVPAWVKRDQSRFPRAERSGGAGIEMLSPFAEANRDAVARAFAAFMAHLRATDAVRTVIMVQVENEIGMIPEARDHSARADELYAGPVPAALTTYLAAHRATLAPTLRERWQSHGSRTEGGWEQVFGAGAATEELFMAWHFALFVEAVAAAGHRAYALPMYVNAALVRPGRQPGEYPSAGPLPHLIDVWRAAAPTIDLLAPDIYFPNFVEWARAYTQPGNPLFIPETGRSPEATPTNAFYAFGQLDAMGFSPFAIESYRSSDALGRSYRVLDQLAPLILEHQGDSSMVGVRPPVSFDGVVDTASQDVRLGDYTLRVTFRDPWVAFAEQRLERHGGLIIQLGPEEYLVAGRGLTVTFSAEGATAGIESVWEGEYVNGSWVRHRLLNGDENHQGRHLRIPADTFAIQRVRLYRYR